MEPNLVNQQIERILRSQSFATKGQLRKLLGVLSKNMDSQPTLNPDLVINELWPDEIRTKRSADVATEMNRLRHALDAYYEREGKTDPIRIVLPNRSAAADGTPERRWIVATPRGHSLDLLAVDPLPGLQVNPRRRLKKIGSIATAIAAVAIATYIAFRILNANDEPKFGRLDGSSLVIMNAEGKELWRKTFPEGFAPDWYDEKGKAPRLWIGNLDGKGHTSVLFAQSSADRQDPHSSVLICYSDHGNEKWRWTPGRELPELNGSPATFKILSIAVLKKTDKKPPRIVVASGHDPWWPSQIALLDSNGKLLSDYWHSGGLNSVVVADLDGDGREEIIATGIANGYDHQATLVVLDPDRVFGASTEVRPEFQIHGMGMAQERLRLLFPRSDLNRALSQFNIATAPTVEQGKIRLTVLECTTPIGCRIWYEFDKSFHLIAAYAGGDEFRSAHARFYQNGKDAHPLTAEEQAAFQKVRCLLGCKTEFVPVGNLLP